MIIIRDTREKVGYWEFDFHGYEMLIQKIETGDYTVLGFEDSICIERKKSTSEIAINIGKDKKRFEAELERMKLFKHKYLILEFSVADLLKFPLCSGLSKEQQKKVRVRPAFLLKRLNEYEIDYGIQIIFACNKQNAMEVALDIMKEAVNEKKV
jgi:ERCC4-type nuclease